MTIAAFVLSSILWAALLTGVALFLQSRTDAPGAMRQWLWRGVAILVAAPWIAAPIAMVLPTPVHVVDAPIMAAPADFGVDFTVEAGPLKFEATPDSPPMPWDTIALAVIVAGWIWRAAMGRVAARNLSRIERVSRRVSSGPAFDAVRRWSARLGLKQTPVVKLIEADISPYSRGLSAPVICLPVAMEQRMTSQALDLIAAHECTHVARGDGISRPLERMVADLLWFNPFAWRIRAELDLARELACDEAVVHVAAEPRAYARTLREVAGMAAGLPAAAPAASMSLSGGGQVIVLRMKRTLQQAKRRPARSAIVAAVLVAALGAPVALAQALLVENVEIEIPDLLAPPPPLPPEPPEVPEVADLVAPPPAPAAPAAPAELAAPPAPAAPPALPTVLAYAPPAPPAPLSPAPSPSPHPVPSASPHPVPSPSLSPAPAAPPAAPRPLTVTGIVKTSWPARVAIVEPGTQGGYRIKVVRIVEANSGDACEIDIDGVAETSLKVGQQLKAGATLSEGRGMRITRSCSSIDMHGSVAPLPPVPAAPQYGQNWTPVAPKAPVAPTALVRYSPQEPTGAAPGKLAGGKRPVLEAPARVTSKYGPRKHPTTGAASFHDGVDLARSQGSEVHAPANGVVVFAGVWENVGNTVEVKMGDHSVRFAQLDSYTVKVGDIVKAGDPIGVIGMSGQNATGPHVHVEVRVNGKTVDPQQVEGLTLVEK